MKDLRSHLVEISNIPREENDRRMVRWALNVGAEAAFSRIRELAGRSYDFANSLGLAETELRDDGSRKAVVAKEISK